jgi:hypothetical protein
MLDPVTRRTLVVETQAAGAVPASRTITMILYYLVLGEMVNLQKVNLNMK